MQGGHGVAGNIFSIFFEKWSIRPDLTIGEYWPWIDLNSISFKAVLWPYNHFSCSELHVSPTSTLASLTRAHASALHPPISFTLP
jgi:hypothetical protein